MKGLGQLLNEGLSDSSNCGGLTVLQQVVVNPWDAAQTIGSVLGPNVDFGTVAVPMSNTSGSYNSCDDCCKDRQGNCYVKLASIYNHIQGNMQVPGGWTMWTGAPMWHSESWGAFIDNLNAALGHHIPSMSNHFNYNMDWAGVKNAFDAIDSSYETQTTGLPGGGSGGIPPGTGGAGFNNLFPGPSFSCCDCEGQGPQEEPVGLEPVEKPKTHVCYDSNCLEISSQSGGNALDNNPNLPTFTSLLKCQQSGCEGQLGGETEMGNKPKKDERQKRQKEKLREGLRNILNEGRVEDAQKYFEDAVGSWPIAEPDNPAGIGASTNLEGVLDHFVQNDPSGNNKYLMWMVKMYLNPEEKGTSPNDISSLVQRFHNNVDRLSPQLISDMGFYSEAPISKSPKDINSYNNLASLERVMDEVDSIQTRKQREKDAKGGADKLYEDERWLLVRPNTYESSCYYGSSTKWCTASKQAPNHFEDYSKKGNLFYIIDKSKDLGDFYKIALYKKFSDGSEEWYDRADNKLSDQTEDAIYSMLPEGLVSAFVNAHEEYEEPEAPLKDIMDFRDELDDVMNKNPQLRKINTKSGTYALDIDSMSGTWVWFNTQNQDIGIYATPFWEGRNGLQIDSADEDAVPLQQHSSEPIIYDKDDLENPGLKQEDYLGTEERFRNSQWGARIFLYQIYLPIIKKVLNQQIFSDALGTKYQTWQPQSHVSSYKFNYPPREGTMTQKFVDYLKQNTGKTANQFYEDILGYPRPRGHNAMFFAAIKDAGIVKMERQGRQFIYSLGPNYQDWVEGRLLRN